MNKAERAIKACREAADALDDMPFRRRNLFGIALDTQMLRDEANYIESVSSVYAAAQEESTYSDE